MNETITHIGPQNGPQKLFLESEADICIYGGAAYGGKTFGLLLDPLRHHDNKHVEAVTFRRTNKQIRNTGGLWDTSGKLYSLLSATPNQSFLRWKFPSGFSVKFDGLEMESSVFDWQGSQIPWIGFDELTHFTLFQFFYMVSRNRSQAGVKGRIRATTNPDALSWVRQFIAWWIDPETGYAIPKRSGKLRWMIRPKDEIEWYDTEEEIYKKYGRGPDIVPRSVTFIPAKIEDNKIGNELDPGYRGALLSLPAVERERLLRGNWNIIPQSGNYFKKEWFEVKPTIRGGWVKLIRFWDRASTKPSPANPDPDWTRGLKLAVYSDGTYQVQDLRSARETPLNIERLIKNTASQDGYACIQMCQQDPGSAGVGEAEQFIKMLAGFQVKTQPFFKDKETRAKAVSAACEAGNISVVKAEWNEELFNELENFPPPKDSGHDDIVDCLSGSYNEVTDSPILSRSAVNSLGRILGQK